MNRKPVILISADSHELHSARKVVADTLVLIGCEPDWLDAGSRADADIAGSIRHRVDDACGVIQLIGHAYGTEPREPHDVFGRISFTQFEALHARQRGKKAWFIILDESFPSDPIDPEPDDKRELQDAYRDIVRTRSQLWHRAASHLDLKKIILGMEGDLPARRHGVRVRGAAAAALVLLIVLAWPAAVQKHRGRQPSHADEKVAPAIARRRKMEQALARLPAVELNSRQPGEALNAGEIRTRACAALEAELGIRAGSLAQDLPAFARLAASGPEAAPLAPARAAYALGQFAEAERLFIAGAAPDRVAALEGAGAAAVAQWQHGRALIHYRAAVALAGDRRDAVESARLQNVIADVIERDNFRAETERAVESIAFVLNSQRLFAGAEKVCRAIVENRRRELGDTHRATLAAKNNLGVVLQSENKNAGAEAAHLAVLRILKRESADDDPDTLTSRLNLAAALSAQGKHGEAESELRAVLDARTRQLGTDHPGTLRIRNSLATELAAQGRNAEAEIEHRAVLQLQQRLLGPEHPDVLASRNNLAEALRAQGRLAEAGEEHAAVLEIRMRLLGPEHPDTLSSRSNLALVLRGLGKNAEAETEHRAVLEIRTRLLGPEHADTLASRNNLAAALLGGGKPAEAEALHREVLASMEKVFGPGHPDVFLSCANIAFCLQEQGKKRDALAFARRALTGWRNTLGEAHPYTQRIRRLVEDLAPEPGEKP